MSEKTKEPNSIRELFSLHTEAVRESLEKLHDVIAAYNAKEPSLKDHSYQLHKIENRADEIRRRTQASITDGAFLPFYRHDYILLADLVDQVANRAVDSSQLLYLIQTDFSAETRVALEKLAEAVKETAAPLPDLIHELFREPKNVEALANAISEGEQKCDSIEWKLLKQIYGEEIGRAEKILQARVVQTLSSVADAVENAADRTRVIVLKQAS